MWTCPTCKEQIGDEFDSCWKCAATAQPSPSPPRAKKPLEQFEAICFIVAAVPGILFTFLGRPVNREDATFRRIAIAVCFIVGIGSFVAIKIYQRTKRKGRK